MELRNVSLQSAVVVQEYNRSEHKDWIATMIINVILLTLVFWILISLIYFGKKSRKWTSTNNNSPEKLNAGLVYTSAIICASFAFLYFIIALVYINIGYNDSNDETCNSMDDLVKSIYGMVVFSVNLFLWLRQRAFYSNRLLNVRFNKAIHIFSNLSIIIIFIGGLSGLIVSTIPNDIVSTSKGCVYVSKNSNPVLSFVLIVSFISFGQVSLLGLFIYALVQSSHFLRSESPHQVTSLQSFFKHTKMKESSTDKTNYLVCSSVKKPYVGLKSSTMVFLIIKKTFIFALLSLFADIIVLIFTFYVDRPGYLRRFSVLIAEIAVFLNLVFVILSFVQWKKILTTFCKLSDYFSDVSHSNFDA